MTSRSFLRLLRLADSGAPVGGFIHSGGIEALARRGAVRSADELAALLAAYRTLTLERCEAWFARSAYRATEAGHAELLVRLRDRELAARPARTQRLASLRLGRGVLELGSLMAGSPSRRDTLTWASGVLGERAPWATALGAVAEAQEIGEDAAAGACVYSALAAQVSAAVRLGLLGADDGQAVLAGVLERPSAEGADGWSSFAPVLDLAQMEHESLEAPGFAS